MISSKDLILFALLLKAIGCSETYSSEEVMERYYDWIENELQSDKELACQNDDNCTIINTDLNCKNIKIISCGTVVNRETAESWSEERMHDDICSLEVENDTIVTRVSICVGGEPGCNEGRCILKRLY